MITTDLLPPTVYVDETTGEVIETSPTADITAESLMTYARAKSEMDAAQLALAERMLELQRSDPKAAELAAKVDQARAIATAVEAGLETTFSAEFRKGLGSGISVDFGFARITWPKPASRWTMREKPERIAAKNPELARLLGIEQSIGTPSAPRITIRAEKLIGGLR